MVCRVTNVQKQEISGILTRMPPMDEAVLEQAMDDFAAHLRRYGEPNLASVVEGAKAGDPVRVPQRVVDLFTHGMGGLLDVPLYTEGTFDREATAKRDELAERMFQAAKDRLR